MAGVFDGVRVIELAQYVYVPGAGVMLADQGAEVIKIETIEGDPYRTLQAGGNRNLGTVNVAMEQNNRNKKSLALDLKSEEGREALLRLVETADVFVTSLRPQAIAALRLDVADLRARNPRLIYARGNGVGFRGEEANRPGYDGSVFWARGGAGYAFTRPGQQLTSPRPAYGDHTGSLALAYGIAGALFKRATTGEASVVENSLLATACWVLSGDLTQVQLPQYETHPQTRPIMPLMSLYETRDGRLVQLMVLQPQPRWAAVCRMLGLDALVDDPRFATNPARTANGAELVALFQAAFAKKDYAEWRPLLEAIDIPWEPVNSIADVLEDPQVHANGMVRKLPVDGHDLDIVAGPTAFDGVAMLDDARPAPTLGSHTDDLLRDLGYASDTIADLRTRGVVK
jgi:crotonobetainyl-CoA:carnitine CoA-transferase CaiB-like acyl-CoA transferase